VPDIKEIIAEKGVETLGEIQKWAKTTQDFATEQIPLVVHEIISWGLASRITAIMFCLSIISLAIFLIYAFTFSKSGQEMWKEKPSTPGDLTCNQGFGIFINISSILAILISSIVSANYIVGVIFILYAPRLYVLQELSDLLKK
jgi:hypothetical protein